jgi:uncharacterized low-complexity protein
MDLMNDLVSVELLYKHSDFFNDLWFFLKKRVLLIVQQCHISRILEISCGDAASPAEDAAPTLGRCGISYGGCASLKEIIHLQSQKTASPKCGCRVSRWRCGISTGDLQNSGYVTLLARYYDVCRRYEPNKGQK